MSVSFDGFDIGSYVLGVLTPVLVVFVGAVIQTILSKRRGY